jgi:hypothetical protein
MHDRAWITTLLDSISRTTLLGLAAPALVLTALACGPAKISTTDPDAADQPDARPMPDASETPDSPPPAPPTHLLISEVTLAPDAAEFIEIYNPGGQAVDLSNYYLSDDADYALLPGKFGNGPAPTLDPVLDFIARFPAGATIGAGEVRVVAMRAEDFQAHFGMAADYALTQASGAQAMRDPDGLIGTGPQLTNAGEAIALFYWDGAGDLVADVDLVHAGVPSAANQLTPKTGIEVDGPDLNGVATSYLADVFTLGVMNGAAGVGFSHKRIAPEGATEIKEGGNGIHGHDETSEDIAQTWDRSPDFSVPTPGEVESGLL